MQPDARKPKVSCPQENTNRRPPSSFREGGAAGLPARSGGGGARATGRGRRQFALRAALLGGALLTAGMALRAPGASHSPADMVPPSPLREFRGAWVATVGNIDWPSRKGLSTAEQQAELLAILDRAARLKLNVVIFQVRPACDALYASRIEPWSEYLTGTMGRAPQPFYDPLAFAVAEAHKRGLELHAWFNPYRARMASASSPVAAGHISKRQPHLVRQYGRYLWLDPGEKQVQDYSLSVIMDVVKRYDVDGIHFDDYFYPYKERDNAGREIDFPDEASWRRHGAGGKLGRDDWRRENVDRFVERVYTSIKSSKPWVKFGVSPFGIWRPGYPAQIKGFDAYAALYADSRKWLANGWLDYFAPQLYWAIEPPDQSFPVLLKWWAAQNPRGRLVVAGMDSTKAGRAAAGANADASRRSRVWPPEEIVNQIRITRDAPNVGGHIHWNMRALMRGAGLNEALTREVYQQPALVPALRWLGGSAPGKPKLALARTPRGAKTKVTWAATSPGKPWLWLAQVRRAGQWSSEVLPGTTTAMTWAAVVPEVVAISAVDRKGNLGPPNVLSLAGRGQ